MQNLNWNWTKSSSYPTKGNGLNVFGTFICGGGSTMGYKLAGYNHLGGVEIDRRMAGLYKVNHNPKYLYVEDIRKFNEREDLPDELYKLNILDGSPPCSTFSLAGNREKDWGKEIHNEHYNPRLTDVKRVANLADTTMIDFYHGRGKGIAYVKENKYVIAFQYGRERYANEPKDCEKIIVEFSCTQICFTF